MLAVVVNMVLPQSWWAWVLFTLCLTGRIFFHAHHLLDVVMGALLAFTVCNIANVLLIAPSCTWTTLVLAQAVAMVGLTYAYKDEKQIH